LPDDRPDFLTKKLFPWQLQYRFREFVSVRLGQFPRWLGHRFLAFFLSGGTLTTISHMQGWESDHGWNVFSIVRRILTKVDRRVLPRLIRPHPRISLAVSSRVSSVIISSNIG
jgi:hypothetical protein